MSRWPREWIVRGVGTAVRGSAGGTVWDGGTSGGAAGLGLAGSCVHSGKGVCRRLEMDQRVYWGERWGWAGNQWARRV